MSSENGTLCSRYSVHLCSWHAPYKPSISSAEQGLQKAVEHKGGEEQWTGLFPTQESVARIVQIMQSNKTVKGHGNQALTECNSARKSRARPKRFQYFGYDCLLSCHRSNSEKFVSRKAEQIDEAKERCLRRDERIGLIRFGWWREFEEMSYTSQKENAINLSETRATATKNKSAEVSEELLKLFGDDAALDVSYTLLGYAPCRDRSNRV